MDQDRLKYLLALWHNNRCNAAEQKEINDWFHAVAHGHQSVDAWVQDSGGEEALSAELYDDFTARVTQKHQRTLIFHYLRIAAIIAIVASATLLLHHANQQKQLSNPKTVAKIHRPDVKKVENKAMLTLANGQQVLLNDIQTGNVALQQNTKIRKTADGKIIYTAAGAKGTEPQVVYNTLTTPRGGGYDLTLADGTTVTLDAESSITYPVAFGGRERVVEISGQAYLRVVHNQLKPFKVKMHNVVIEDLGTEFNVNSYRDDPSVKVTLAQGLVNVSSYSKRASLVPGQQAVVKNGQQDIVLKQVNVNEVIAWKDGWFIFHNETLVNIMKKAERWYDVEIRYEGDPTQKKFGGNLSKYKDIAELLENLKISGGIQYKVEGRRVIISN